MSEATLTLQQNRSLSTPLRWGVAAAVMYVAITGGYLLRENGNPQWFVHFGKQHPAIPLAEQRLGKPLRIPHEDGHDGQANWVLASDPLLLDGLLLRQHLDRPAYRAQRLGYPLLCAPWRLLGETPLLWGMLLTNLATVFLGAWLAAALARDLDANPRAGFIALALAPGVFVAVIMNLADALALATLIATLLALQRRRYGWALAAAVLMVLTKEIMLLALLGVALLNHTIPRKARIGLVAIPAATIAAWGLYVRWRLGWPPAQIQELDWPLHGYWYCWNRGWRIGDGLENAIVAIALLPLAALGVWRHWRRRSLLTAAALPFCLLIPLLSHHVLDLALNSIRAATPALALLILDAYATKKVARAPRAGV